MLLEPLAKNSTFDFLVNERGEALILHKGPLKADYCWLQYDSHSGTVQLVTETGELQEMGYKLTPKVKELLIKTRLIPLLEVDDKNICHQRKTVVFTTVLN